MSSFILLAQNIMGEIDQKLTIKMSSAQNHQIKKETQFTEPNDKISSETFKYTDSACQQVDFRFLSFENYFKKQKQGNVSFDSLALLSMVFNFAIQNYFPQNTSNIEKNHFSKIKSLSERPYFEDLIKFNSNKDFFKSFSGFTRKSNSFVYLLINHFKKREKLQQTVNQHKVKITFFNEDGMALHIYSNLQFGSFEKVNQILKRHCSQLDMLVMLNKGATLQESRVIFNILSRRNLKILAVTIPQSSQLGQQEKVVEHLGELKLQKNIFYIRRDNQYSNFYMFGSPDLDFQMQNRRVKVNQMLQISQIEQFVVKEMLGRDFMGEQMILRNQFVINCLAWCLNILGSMKKSTNILQQNSSVLRQDLIKKMMGLSLKGIQNVEQQVGREIEKKLSEMTIKKEQQTLRRNRTNKNQHKSCWPHLFETSKKCIVCKESKPKYGCRQCSLKYKMDIHLCINGCFKIFHTENARFMNAQNNVNQIKQFSPDPISTHHPNNSQLRLRNETKIYLKNTKKIIQKHKLIKKKAKKIATQQQVSKGIYKGIGSYNLLFKGQQLNKIQEQLNDPLLQLFGIQIPDEDDSNMSDSFYQWFEEVETSKGSQTYGGSSEMKQQKEDNVNQALVRNSMRKVRDENDCKQE